MPVCTKRRTLLLTRRDWLTLLIAFEGSPGGLDPVRLQKGLFLFSKEATTVPEAQKYVFKPYSYGPMSRDIYTDLDALVAGGLVEKVAVEGQSWSRYKPSNRGIERAHRIMQEAVADYEADAMHLYGIKQAVSSMSFADLLEDVYARYPAYAEKSIFKRR